MILGSVIVSVGILLASSIKISIRNDGIYKDYNLSPFSEKQLAKAEDIFDVEAKPNENAQASADTNFRDKKITTDLVGSVHIKSREGRKFVISAEDAEGLASEIRSEINLSEDSESL